MFFIPRVNVVESDQGFSVEVLGRSGVRYVEGGCSLLIDSELLNGPDGIAIYSSSIKTWDVPNTHEPIDPSDKARIIENVRDAFRFRGFEIEVM